MTTEMDRKLNAMLKAREEVYKRFCVFTETFNDEVHPNNLVEDAEALFGAAERLLYNTRVFADCFERGFDRP